MEGGDWQSRKLPSECNKHALDNELFTDVEFCVGEERKLVKAHKFILASRSPVFEKMFFGALPETTSPIAVPDVQPEGLRNLLRCCYYECLDIKPKDALTTLYAAKKYLLPLLEEKCRTIQMETLGTTTIWTVYTWCITHPDDELLDACHNFFNKSATAVSSALKSAAFLDVPISVISDLLHLNRGNNNERERRIIVAEVRLFEACIAWATAECQRQDIEPSGYNKRAVLGDSWLLLHYEEMLVRDVITVVSPTCVLKSDEICKILQDSAQPCGTLSKPQYDFLLPVNPGLNASALEEMSVVFNFVLTCSFITTRVNNDLLLSAVWLKGYENADYHAVSHEIAVIDTFKKKAWCDSHVPQRGTAGKNKPQLLVVEIEPVVLRAGSEYEIIATGKQYTYMNSYKLSRNRFSYEVKSPGDVAFVITNNDNNEHIVGLQVHLV